MPPVLTFLLMVVSGWVRRHQVIAIEYLQAENRLLKERLKGKRIRFTDAERALLARKAKAVGRKALLTLDTIVSPDTLLRWHRRLIAEKWNYELHAGTLGGEQVRMIPQCPAIHTKFAVDFLHLDISS